MSLPYHSTWYPPKRALAPWSLPDRGIHRAGPGCGSRWLASSLRCVAHPWKSPDPRPDPWDSTRLPLHASHVRPGPVQSGAVERERQLYSRILLTWPSAGFFILYLGLWFSEVLQLDRVCLCRIHHGLPLATTGYQDTGPFTARARAQPWLKTPSRPWASLDVCVRTGPRQHPRLSQSLHPRVHSNIPTRLNETRELVEPQSHSAPQQGGFVSVLGCRQP